MATQTITLEMSSKGAQSIVNNLNGINKSLRTQTEQAGKTTEVLAKGFNGATAKMRDFTIILSGAINFGKSFIGLGKQIASVFAEQTAVAAKLVDDTEQLRVTLAGIETDKTADYFVDYTDKLSLASGQSQDFLLRLAKLSTQLTNSAEHTEGMTEAAIALSKTVGISAETAIRGLSQTLEGQVGVLGRYMPALRNLTAEQLRSGEAINLINDRFGPALEARLDITTGQYERLTNIIGDRYLEVLGLSIADNKAFAAGLKEIGDQLVLLAPAVSDLMPIMQELIVMSARLVSSLLNGSAIFAQFVGGLVKGIGNLISDMIHTAFMPLQSIIDGIVGAAESLGIESPLIEFAGELSDKFDDIANTSRDVGDSVDRATDSIADGMAIAAKVIDRAADAVEDFDHTAKKSADTRKSISKTSSSASKKAADDAAKELKLKTKYRLQYLNLIEKTAQQIAAENEKLRLSAIASAEATAQAIAAAQADASAASRSRVGTVVSALPGGGLVSTLALGSPDEAKDALANFAATAIQGTLSGIASALQRGFELVKGAFDYFIDGITDVEAFEERAAGVGDFLASIVDEDNIARFAESFFNAIDQVFKFLSDPEKVGLLVDNFINFITQLFNTIVADLGPILEVLIPAILQIVEAVFELLASSDFISTIVDAAVKLLLGVIRVLIENLPTILSNLVKAALDGITEFIEGLIDMLVEPDFISNFVVGIVNLIFDIIEGIAKMIDKIVFKILQNLMPIVIEVFKAVVKAIAQILLRGLWAVLRIIVRVATLGTVDIGDPPSVGGTDTAKSMHYGGRLKLRRAHNGAALKRGEDIITQTDEAIVVPRSPRQFGGLTTDGQGRVQQLGGQPAKITYNIQALDAASFKDFLRRNGMSAINDMIQYNIPDAEGRTMARLLRG